MNDGSSMGASLAIVFGRRLWTALLTCPRAPVRKPDKDALVLVHCLRDEPDVVLNEWVVPDLCFCV